MNSDGNSSIMNDSIWKAYSYRTVCVHVGTRLFYYRLPIWYLFHQDNQFGLTSTVLREYSQSWP